MVGVGEGVWLGALLGVAVVLLGAGLGSSWVQATGPTRNAATNRAVMIGRRTTLLGLWVRRLVASRSAVHRRASARGLFDTVARRRTFGCPAARRGGNMGRRDVGTG
jgi:hypothetical protein